MLKPVHRDVAFDGAFVAHSVAEMAVDRRAVVVGVALLEFEPVGQKGVAARGIDHEAGLPLVFKPIVAARRHRGAARLSS